MTQSDLYPRDLAGYGVHPPHPHWPEDARIAVSFVLNFEEGGEHCVLHGDPHSESVLTDLGALPLAAARNLNVESNFEYGTRVGFWEIMRLLREYRIEATIYAVGMALERNPEAAAELARSGFEVACHGQRWIDYQFVAENVERADMSRNVEVITRLVGRPPTAGIPAGRARIRAAWWSRWAAFSMTAMRTTMICRTGRAYRTARIWSFPTASTRTTAACSAAGTSPPARIFSLIAAMHSTGCIARVSAANRE